MRTPFHLDPKSVWRRTGPTCLSTTTRIFSQLRSKTAEAAEVGLTRVIRYQQRHPRAVIHFGMPRVWTDGDRAGDAHF